MATKEEKAEVKYDSGQKPKRGDVVHGVFDGEKVAGKIFSIDAKAGTAVLERQGPAVLSERFRKMVRGGIQHLNINPEDFTLIYRREG